MPLYNVYADVVVIVKHKNIDAADHQSAVKSVEGFDYHDLFNHLPPPVLQYSEQVDGYVAISRVSGESREFGPDCEPGLRAAEPAQ